MLNADTNHGLPPIENALWQGHTSQWINFWFYVFCVVLAGAALAGIPFTQGLSAAGLIVPAVMWIVKWWATRRTHYELTTQRLKIRRGILNRRLEEIELYRVKDYVLDEPMALRIVGLGNVTVITSDPSTGSIVLRAIPRAETVREQLRNAVQIERDRKRVREIDFEDMTPAE